MIVKSYQKVLGAEGGSRHHGALYPEQQQGQSLNGLHTMVLAVVDESVETNRLMK